MASRRKHTARKEADRGGGDEERGARSFWSGTISFGLVSVPVALFPGTRAERASLRMLAPDGTPLERRWHCPKDDKDVAWSQLVRGFETDDGDYVGMTATEIESAAPDKSRDIDLRRFVPRGSLDPVFFERGYFLVPSGESTKAYRLLAQAMEKTGLAGIATFVMRTKEYLVAILAEDGLLRAETLRWAGEVRTPADVGLGKPAKAAAADVRRVTRAIKAHTTRSLSEKELEDASVAKLAKLVRSKLRKGEDVIEAPEGAEPTPADEGIIDLMEVLKRSLEGEGGSRPGGSHGARKGPKRAPRRTRTAKSGGRARKRKAS